jgi:peptidoglycan/xylan/chitin deacetylase (PgdA/CDA1 family)
MSDQNGFALRRQLRDTVSKVLFSAGLTRPERALAGRLTIVTFHRVLPERLRARYPFPGLVVTPEEFRWFVEFFRRHFECGSLLGMMRRRASHSRKPLLAITFDDGMDDNFEHARPVLRSAGVNATFFVTSDALHQKAPLWHDRMAYSVLALLEQSHASARALLKEVGIEASQRPSAAACVEQSKRWPPERRRTWLSRAADLVGDPVPAWNGFMSAQKLRVLASEGDEIGSHSASHEILPRCDDAALRREVFESKAVLERELGVEVESFCYPNGDQDGRVVSATRRAGYRYAVTTLFGTNAAVEEPVATAPADFRRPDSPSS